MNILLLAFALPVATILIAIVLQKILKCPLLVATTFFAILLIITYAIFDSSFLVFAILYTILAYVTAVLTQLICNLICRFNLNTSCICNNMENQNNCCRQNTSCSVTSGTWCYKTRDNNTRNGINQIPANALSNNGRGCTCENNQNNDNEPVIILTNSNNIVNRNCRNRRNSCNCNCNR